MNNIIAIVGRPNVGKSTLFNRLTQSRQAIVNENAGTTRDRQYGKVEWNGKIFSIIDTGGWMVHSGDIFENEINKQVNIAIEEADIILFMVDSTNGITDIDNHVANVLRKCNKTVLLISNKTDTFDVAYQASEFYKLGLGDPIPISAINGLGTGDLLDAITSRLKETQEEEIDNNIPKIAIVGRPNAGKSSLLNAFIGEERSIVTNIAGTTRDSVYTKYNKFGLNFYLIDTAGIRKKNKVNEDLEYYSVIRSIRAIESCDIAILMLDATRGIETQDMNIFSLIKKNKKGLVIVVNKWDSVQDKDKEVIDHYKNSILSRISPFKDVPIIFTSATTKQRIFKILETANKVYKARKQKISTHQLNEILLPIIQTTPPPMIKGKVIKIKYITQITEAETPCFIFFCNLPQWIKDPYKRFLENKIRENWDFKGTPINIFMREK